MFKPVRVVASIVFIASIVLVLVGAFALGNEVCSLIFNRIPYISDSFFFRYHLDSMSG